MKKGGGAFLNISGSSGKVGQEARRMFCGPLYSGARTKETMPPGRPGWPPPDPTKGKALLLKSRELPTSMPNNPTALNVGLTTVRMDSR